MKTLVLMMATATLLVSSMPSAQANTWVFKDVLRPSGHSRSIKTKFADAHRCGAVGDNIPDQTKDSILSCMSAHGWVRDHIIPDPPRYAQKRNNTQDDYELRKRNWEASDDAERQRDEEARNDDAQRQQEDQNNTDRMISNLNNQ